MTVNICNRINSLTEYAIRCGLAVREDKRYLINRLLEALSLDTYEESGDVDPSEPLESILADICDYAGEKGMIDKDSVTERDLFDTRIMGILTPRPSEVTVRFREYYAEDKKKATDYFYKLCCDCDYIRTYRIAKDVHWEIDSEFGDIQLSINLAKPEKDPKAIAAAKNAPQGGYPKCQLCPENEGYAGRMNHPARQNHRIIPMTIAGEDWFLQYSPYSYYNEHCIVLSGEHRPMKINRAAFVKLIDFIEFLPHYFLGSNADLPIVGGSILSHDHMQGGRHTFPMEKAPVEKSIVFEGYEEISAGIVKWPLSVIRLNTAPENRDKLTDLCVKILEKWRGYSDESANIIVFSDGEPHNTITPIARNKNGNIEIDLVLRCNITSAEHPLGVFHPHAEKHNIKKENIGLIEVMGLAVLPSRLKNELKWLEECVLMGRDPADDERVSHHAAWFNSFKDNYSFDSENVHGILFTEVGRTFVEVLKDAGVYKCTEEGRRAFETFCKYVNA